MRFESDDREDALNPGRALVYGTLISLVFWAVIGFVWWLQGR